MSAIQKTISKMFVANVFTILGLYTLELLQDRDFEAFVERYEEDDMERILFTNWDTKKITQTDIEYCFKTLMSGFHLEPAIAIEIVNMATGHTLNIKAIQVDSEEEAEAIIEKMKNNSQVH